jgi:hypothetical protein
MQIFACHEDPLKAARYLKIKEHITKMPLECIQILFGAHYYLGGLPAGAPAGAYRYSNKNHPCIVWAATSVNNYKWLLAHAREIFAMFDEQQARNRARDIAMGKPPSATTAIKPHGSFKHLEWLERCIPPCPNVERTPFALVINDAELLRMGITQPRDQIDVFAAYRLYASEEMVNLRFEARAVLRKQISERKKTSPPKSARRAKIIKL